MDAKRALREALATVLVPSAVIWGGLAFVLRRQLDSFALLVIFLAFLLPLVLFFPSMGGIRREVTAKVQFDRHDFIFGREFASVL